MRHFGFEGSSALICSDDGQVLGMTQDELLARAEHAQLLVNISGHLRWEPIVRRVAQRAFVDLDPGFTQIWHAQGDVDAAGLVGHDLHSVGMNVGGPHWPLPDNDVEWRPILQPVVLDRWPVADGEFSRFTTVASWRGAFGATTWAGRTYGVKAHTFRRFAAVPRSVGVPFAIALDIHAADAADVERLEAGGWELLDPQTCGDVERFRRFVQGSGAEFSTAQEMYVATRSGWFSDRSVRYLASGRPVLVQDTGFSEHLPVGAGLLTFDGPAAASRAARAIVEDYDAHRVAARRIAEQHFAPRQALAPLLEATGVPAA
jgi:hypothetical protein